MDFFTGLPEIFDGLKDAFLLHWNMLPVPARIIVALSIAIGLLYLGSKSEEVGWGTVLLLSSLGFFTYLLMLGFALVR